MDITIKLTYEYEKWHIIEIEPDGLSTFGRPALTSRYKKEVEQWIEDHYNTTEFGIWKDAGFCKYGFRNEEDAVAFKLRWV